MKRAISTISALLLLATVGVGAVSADPINTNSRYLHVICNGEVLPLVTNHGGVAQVLDDTRVLVLQGITRDGIWILPINNGQLKGGQLVECPYVEHFDGHTFVAWMNISGPKN